MARASVLAWASVESQGHKPLIWASAAIHPAPHRWYTRDGVDEVCRNHPMIHQVDWQSLHLHNDLMSIQQNSVSEDANFLPHTETTETIKNILKRQTA